MNFSSNRQSLAHPGGRWQRISKNFSDIRLGLTSWHASGIKEMSSEDGTYAVLDLLPPFGRGFFEFIALGDDLSVVIADALLMENHAFKLRGDEWLRFHFRVSLTNTLLFDSSRQYDLSGPFSQMLLLPEDCEHTDWFNADNPMQWVSIYCKRQTITEVLGCDPDLFEDQVKSCLSDDAATLYLEHRDLGGEFYMLVNQICKCSMPVPLKKVYIKAKVLELVSEYLSGSLPGKPQEKATLILKKYDIERINEARFILESELARDIGIADLSKQIGLNRNKLTCGFKQLFGKTVHAFHMEKRLLKAWAMLEEDDLNLSIIASEVGYAHHPSFTAAFKKHFGIGPKDVRKKLNKSRESAGYNRS